MLETRPTAQQLRKHWSKYPSRWIDAMATLAKLAGFTERSESVSLNISTRINSLSDVELEAELSRIMAVLHGDESDKAPLLINTQSTEIPHADDQHTSIDAQRTDIQLSTRKRKKPSPKRRKKVSAPGPSGATPKGGYARRR